MIKINLYILFTLPLYNLPCRFTLYIWDKLKLKPRSKMNFNFVLITKHHSYPRATDHLILHAKSNLPSICHRTMEITFQNNVKQNEIY